MSEILNGILNTMFPDQEIEDEAKRRMFQCILPEGENPHCASYNPEGKFGPKCDECGCTLKFKIRSVNSECPRDKWKLKQEEDDRSKSV